MSIDEPDARQDDPAGHTDPPEGQVPPETKVPPDRATPAVAPVHSAPTRVSASWTAVVVGVLILILLIVFVAENTQRAQVNFFGVHGHASTAVVLLIAAVAGAVIVVAVGVSRILQLRQRAKRAEREARR